jgi:ribosomal protein S18 acetylase RimI-like enzyme
MKDIIKLTDFNLFNKFLITNLMKIAIDKIYYELKATEKLYPNFNYWFYNKVIPDVLQDKRKILLEIRNNEIAGIAIIKNTSEEKKLCTLRVTSKYQNKGIGLKLFERAFEELNTSKPFLTVSEEKYKEFEKIFKYYGFELTNKIKDYYRKGKSELFFNEFSK